MRWARNSPCYSFTSPERPPRPAASPGRINARSSPCSPLPNVTADVPLHCRSSASTTDQRGGKPSLRRRISRSRCGHRPLRSSAIAIPHRHCLPLRGGAGGLHVDGESVAGRRAHVRMRQRDRWRRRRATLEPQPGSHATRSRIREISTPLRSALPLEARLRAPSSRRTPP